MKFVRYMILIGAFLLSIPVAMAENTGANSDTGPETGTVAETMDASTYTYIKLEEQGVWVATPKMSVSVGERVEYSGGMQMGEFHSKALDRTFEEILFVENVKVISRNIADLHGTAVSSHGAQEMEIPNQVAIEAPAPGDIEQLVGGKSVAEIFSESAELEGEVVKLRALVTKVNEQILGRNWITLQDGTGMAPENQLLTTSQELVSPGDLVVASGTLRNDADIGSGYQYKVLLEETTFIKNPE